MLSLEEVVEAVIVVLKLLAGDTARKRNARHGSLGAFGLEVTTGRSRGAAVVNAAAASSPRGPTTEKGETGSLNAQ